VGVRCLKNDRFHLAKSQGLARRCALFPRHETPVPFCVDHPASTGSISGGQTRTDARDTCAFFEGAAPDLFQCETASMRYVSKAGHAAEELIAVIKRYRK
jgi:hypothetical protein